MLDEALRRHPQEGELGEVVRAGAAASGEYRCSGCGYGVTVQSALPHCPMCAGTRWEPAAPGPVSPDGRLL